jgi:hypothetical protein
MANNNDALIPEIWANESLLFLENNLVLGNLVHRDFSAEVQRFGDVVNTRRPDGFTAVRKTDADAITVQDASLTNVAIKLDQHLHCSFIIKDGEESKSIKLLVEEHLAPAMSAIVQSIDQTIATQSYKFLANNVGQLGVPITKTTLTAARKVLNQNKAPVLGRSLVVGSTNEAELLNDDLFVSAERVGDEGTALREGSLGRKFGFQIHMDQNMPEFDATGLTVVANTVAGATAAGATSIDLTSAAGITVGDFIVFAGDGIPQLITAVSTNTLTISPGLKRSVVNLAVATAYTHTAVDLVAGYVAGFTKPIVTDAMAKASGQLVQILGTKYGIIGVPTTTSMVLNTATAGAFANNDVVSLGPAGNYAFAFHKNALAVISRPLALPRDPSVRSAVASYGGYAVRVTMGYDMYAQGVVVTIDLLLGTEVLDVNLGCVILG